MASERSQTPTRSKNSEGQTTNASCHDDVTPHSVTPHCRGRTGAPQEGTAAPVWRRYPNRRRLCPARCPHSARSSVSRSVGADARGVRRAALPTAPCRNQTKRLRNAQRCPPLTFTLLCPAASEPPIPVPATASEVTEVAG